MSDLFDGYPLGAAWDEVFARDGSPHADSAALHAALQLLSAEDLAARSTALQRAFRDQGNHVHGGSQSLRVSVEVTRLA